MKSVKNHVDSKAGVWGPEAERGHRAKASDPSVWEGSQAGSGRLPSEFPNFPAYRKLCGETREGEMPRIYRWLPQRGGSFTTHSMEGPGRGDHLLDDACHVFQAGFLTAPSHQCCAGALGPRRGRILAEKSEA